MQDILIQIFNLDVDFSLIFDNIKEPYKKEILDYINYVKSKPLKRDLLNYKISEKSRYIIIEHINYLLRKIKN